MALPYKTSYYDDIPEWAKDPEGEGYWMLAYKGTMAFLVDTEGTNGQVPTSWKAVSEGDYTLTIGMYLQGTRTSLRCIQLLLQMVETKRIFNLA